MGSFADAMQKERERDERNREMQVAKMGDYDNPPDGCPNCGRQRVMLGDDGKHRCEKCCWCIEDGEYDGAFLDYMK